MRDESDEALRRHRALADPSRARILAELAADGPLDSRQLAARMGLHVNTVRAHVAALAEAGLVAAETVPQGGRGRPRRVYRALAERPDEGRRYRLLAEILTTLVARAGQTARDELVETGALWGRHLVESPAPLQSLSEAEAVGRLLELLDDVGFQPRLERATGGERVLMRPCPFLELARRHTEVVCPIHLGLMRGALAELGARTRATRLEPFVGPDRCTAHLAAP